MAGHVISALCHDLGGARVAGHVISALFHVIWEGPGWQVM